MKGILSLDQELRAARLAKGQKKGTQSDHSSAQREHYQPWQPEIDRMQQTMREVLRAIAGISGVELPGLPAGLQDDAVPQPKLDINTLKDRFRNDLEGFSIKTTEELTKRAREQTRAALDEVQNEVLGAGIDQVAAELREKLQAPVQIEKFVGSAIEEAAARLEMSLSQKIERLIAEQQQLVQDKLQGALGAVHAQVNAQVDAEFREILQLPAQIEKLVEPAVEKAAARLESSLRQKVEHQLAGQQQLLQDGLQGTLTAVQSQVSTQIAAELRDKLQPPAQIDTLVDPAVEKAAARLEESLSQKIERLLAEHEHLVQDKLRGALSSVQAQVSTQIAAELRDKLQPAAQIDTLVDPAVEKAAARLEMSLSQKIEHLLAEHEQMVQDKIQGALSSVQARINTLEQSVQQIREIKAVPVVQAPVEQPTAKVEHLLAEQERLVQDRLEGALSTVQARINTLEQSVQQISELKTVPVAQAPVEQPVVPADNAETKLESSVDSGFKGFLDHAFSRIESSFNNLLETPKKEPVQTTHAKLEGLRRAIPDASTDKLIRIQQALDNLDRLGPKNPPPAS
ncbi:MAG TPA: hypothetical protein VNM47_17160 [Terriglobia bacterium]|nr:hypothetical protein [Terriglobia bacterium]